MINNPQFGFIVGYTATPRPSAFVKAKVGQTEHRRPACCTGCGGKSWVLRSKRITFFFLDSHTKPGKWTLKEMVFSWKNRVFSQFSMSRWILWAGKTPSHLSNCESTTFGKPIWIHTSSDLKPWPRTGYRTLTVESSQDPIWSTSNLCPAQLRFC
jgi:hypothetical protein